MPWNTPSPLHPQPSLMPSAAVLMGEGTLRKANLGARSSGGFSLSVKNFGLCSVLIVETSPIVYFTTIYVKEKRRIRKVYGKRL